MKGDNILTTDVFEINGDKANFAENLIEEEVVEFENFNLLFEKINELFNEE